MLPTVSEGVLRDEKRSCIGMRERGAAVSGVEGGGVRDGRDGGKVGISATERRALPEPVREDEGVGVGHRLTTDV